MKRILCAALVVAVLVGRVQAQTPVLTLDPPPSEWALLARGPLPGFAGIAGLTYPNQPGELPRCVVRIAMTDTVKQRKKIEQHFEAGELGSPYPPGVCIGVRTFQAIQVRYDYGQLELWMRSILQKPANASAAGSARIGSFMRARVMVSPNRIEIFSTDSVVRAQLTERASQLEIPSDAIKIDLAPPPSSGRTEVRVTGMLNDFASESAMDAMRASELEGFASFSPNGRCSALVSAKDTSDAFKRKAEGTFQSVLAASQQSVPGLCPRAITLSYRKVKFDAGELFAWYRFSFIKIPKSASVPSRSIDRDANAVVFILEDLKDSMTIRQTLQEGSVPGDALRFESVLSRASNTRVYFEFQVDQPARVIGAYDKLYDQIAKPYPGPPSVTIQFVVTPKGEVDLSTLRVIRSSDATLSARLLKEIPTLRFAPAVKDGLPVRQILMANVSDRVFF